MNLIFDTHAHYDDEAFDADREELLSSMPENGVGLIVLSVIPISSITSETILCTTPWLQPGQ